MKISTIIFLPLFLAGCSDSSRAEFEKSFDESFRRSFRTSFVDSCMKDARDEKFRESCTCVADDLLENMTKSELMDSDKIRNRLKEVSMAKCRPAEASTVGT